MLSNSFSKELLPALGRRDFCRPAKLSRLQGPELDGYGCGATLWVTWKVRLEGFTPAPSPELARTTIEIFEERVADRLGWTQGALDQSAPVERDWNRHDERDKLQEPPPRPNRAILVSVAHFYKPYLLILPCDCTRNT